MKTSLTVDKYLRNTAYWHDELVTLRRILASTKLTEDVKWGAPCYTWQGKNVVGLGAFKSYFGLWFFQGALLEDGANVLINAQEGKTKALRQWRMQSASDIKPTIIKRYIREAIGLVDAGKELRADRSQPVAVPGALQEALRRDTRASTAFRGLTKGRQREYADYIASARRADTVKRRIDKILPMITAGAGLNDKYR